MVSRIIMSLCAAGAAGATTIGGVESFANPQPGAPVAALIERAAEAHARLMRGDIAGYRRAIDIAPDFTLMDPFGGTPSGAPSSEAHWQRIGRFFKDGRDAGFETISTYRSNDMIVLVAKERAHVAVGQLPAQDWLLRVTLVFRRDGGAWRLVHRHADPLVLGLTVQQAGQITRGQIGMEQDR